MSTLSHPSATHIEAQFLDDSGVLPGGQPAVVLALGARADHLARAEDERRGARLSDAHDDRSEPLRVVLGVPRLHRDLAQVQLAQHVDGGDDVPEDGVRWSEHVDGGDMMIETMLLRMKNSGQSMLMEET